MWRRWKAGESLHEIGNCTAGQSMSDVIAGHSVEGIGMTE
jgi:hypothetical protein